MDRAEEYELGTVGRLLSLNMATAFALALAGREGADPRGAIAEVLAAIEEELGDHEPALREKMSAEQVAAVLDAARSNTLSIGRMADSFLKAMGAPPASS